MTSILTETPFPFWTFSYTKMTVSRSIMYNFTRARYPKTLFSAPFLFHFRHLILLYFGLSIIDIRLPSILAALSIFATSSNISTFTRLKALFQLLSVPFLYHETLLLFLICLHLTKTAGL